jgi:hypothetical protein
VLFLVLNHNKFTKFEKIFKTVQQQGSTGYEWIDSKLVFILLRTEEHHYQTGYFRACEEKY